jgi:hypothetical protein
MRIARAAMRAWLILLAAQLRQRPWVPLSVNDLTKAKLAYSVSKGC